MRKIDPLVPFYFDLAISGQESSPPVVFKEVSGISMEMNTEDIGERGQNSFQESLPTSAEFSNLILKRGLMPQNSGIALWCSESFSAGLDAAIKTNSITVRLLNGKGNPLKSWLFVNSWPIKWAVSEFDSMNNEMVIDHIEFSYSYFNRLNAAGDLLAE